MSKKILVECIDCKFRQDAKTQNYSNGRYKSAFKEKQFCYHKMKGELRNHRNHMRQMVKKLNWMIKETEKVLKKY